MLSSNRWPIPSTKRTSWGLWIAWTRGTLRREMAWTQSIYVNLRQIHLLHLFWHVFPHLWCGVVLATSTSQKVSTGQNLKPKNPPWVAKRQLRVEKRFFLFFVAGSLGKRARSQSLPSMPWDHEIIGWVPEKPSSREAQSLLWDGLLVEAATARQMATEDKVLRVEAMLPSLLTSGLGQNCPSPKLVRTSRIWGRCFGRECDSMWQRCLI